MNIEQAKELLIRHYGPKWFHLCADCGDWSDADIIQYAKGLEYNGEERVYDCQV